MNKHREAMAEVYDAADKFWRQLPAEFDDACIVGQTEPDPTAAAALIRFAVGNQHDPIDLVDTARKIGLNISSIPGNSKDLVPAFGAWFDETPVLLIADVVETPTFRHRVSQEIGGMLLTKTIDWTNYGHSLPRVAKTFADAFLYPDTAVQELKHTPSRQRFRDHMADFGVPAQTILRRLLSIRKV